jgi:hypothetical protein
MRETCDSMNKSLELGRSIGESKSAIFLDRQTREIERDAHALACDSRFARQHLPVHAESSWIFTSGDHVYLRQASCCFLFPVSCHEADDPSCSVSRITHP